MARHAVGITFDRAELFIAAGSVEARRLKTHRIDIRPDRSELPRLVLDRLHQLRAEVLAAIFPLDPEELDRRLNTRKPLFLEVPGLIQKIYGRDEVSGDVCGIYFF